MNDCPFLNLWLILQEIIQNELIVVLKVITINKEEN